GGECRERTLECGGMCWVVHLKSVPAPFSRPFKPLLYWQSKAGQYVTTVKLVVFLKRFDWRALNCCHAHDSFPE
ncbi:MAG: hypothetical protein QF437_26985, partial [Planctomycetota bacterium]|nr:hypothetical protein [Planctomycetota bacterium]